MTKVLISACLLAIPVRYDGRHNQCRHPLLTKLKQQNRLISICPEVCGGLSTPRDPAEIQPDTGQIKTNTGQDVSDAFQRGAEHALSLCQKHGIKAALLKESSPSCGSNLIYDGSFSAKKIAGQGVTAKLLQQHGIRVFSELTIAELADYLAE